LLFSPAATAPFISLPLICYYSLLLSLSLSLSLYIYIYYIYIYIYTQLGLAHGLLSCPPIFWVNLSY
ncbi:hypothetical protein ACMBCM_07355, partial [Spiroplasma sp. K1]